MKKYSAIVVLIFLFIIPQISANSNNTELNYQDLDKFIEEYRIQYFKLVEDYEYKDIRDDLNHAIFFLYNTKAICTKQVFLNDGIFFIFTPKEYLTMLKSYPERKAINLNITQYANLITAGKLVNDSSLIINCNGSLVSIDKYGIRIKNMRCSSNIFQEGRAVRKSILLNYSMEQLAKDMAMYDFNLDKEVANRTIFYRKEREKILKIWEPFKNSEDYKACLKYPECNYILFWLRHYERMGWHISFNEFNREFVKIKMLLIWESFKLKNKDIIKNNSNFYMIENIIDLKIHSDENYTYDLFLIHFNQFNLSITHYKEFPKMIDKWNEFAKMNKKYINAEKYPEIYSKAKNIMNNITSNSTYTLIDLESDLQELNEAIQNVKNKSIYSKISRITYNFFKDIPSAVRGYLLNVVAVIFLAGVLVLFFAIYKTKNINGFKNKVEYFKNYVRKSISKLIRNLFKL